MGVTILQEVSDLAKTSAYKFTHINQFFVKVKALVSGLDHDLGKDAPHTL